MKNKVVVLLMSFFVLNSFVLDVVFSADGLQNKTGNQLENHASPYLAMHGNDPVQWQEWSASVLEQAKNTNKLIFISSGYFSCHWCHVMHRESYSNPELAALLNQYFIPVKIDRELRPALDDYLIDFVQQTAGHAGWPLNVFLTPEGYPLMGLTYAPLDNFRSLLFKISDAWSTQPDKANRLAKEAAEFLQKSNVPEKYSAKFNVDKLSSKLFDQALSIADDLEGGFGDQNRFPMTPQLLVLLDFLKENKSVKVAEFLELTLDQMKSLGLRDHVNGGFFRYTVDPAWTEPHFEKMLYTQALMIQVYLDAAVVLDKPDYLDVAKDTLDFVLRDMRAEKGGFISSYSAVDDKGIEGSGYLWTHQELSQYLNDSEQRFLKKYWNLETKYHFEKGNLPLIRQPLENVMKDLNLSIDEAQNLLESAKKKLRRLDKKSLMPIDNKILTSWNALFLSALSQAAIQLKDDNYREQAIALKNSLIKQSWDSVKLFRARDKNIGRAGLEDYAYMAKAMDDYAKLIDIKESQDLAMILIEKAWAYFYHSSGWKTGDENLLPAMTGKPALPDGALPAADAILMRLSLMSENPDIKLKAKKASQLMLSTVLPLPFSYSTHTFYIKYLH